MSTRTHEQFVLPGFSQRPSVDTARAAEALARYEARCRGDVATLVVEARTYGLSLEQVLALVRAVWEAPTEA
jgi:hypothetical protein